MTEGLPRATFVRVLEETQRRLTRFRIMLFCCGMCVFLIPVIAMAVVPRWVRFGPFVFVAYLVVMIPGVLAGLAWVRAASPSCPRCGRRLSGALLAIAIATDRCGHCGETICSDS